MLPNEFIDEPVFLECQSDYVIVIYSKDRSWYGVYDHPLLLLGNLIVTFLFVAKNQQQTDQAEEDF